MNQTRTCYSGTRTEPNSCIVLEPEQNPVFDNFTRTRTEPNRTFPVLEPKQNRTPAKKAISHLLS